MRVDSCFRRTVAVFSLVGAAAVTDSFAAPARITDPFAVDLFDVRAFVPDAVLDLRYAGPNNVAQRAVYDAAECLVRAETGRALARAADALRAVERRLLLWDCYRPWSVQKVLFATTPVPGLFAHPAVGSPHNRGVAVDLGIVRADGSPVPLPTDFDVFTPDARRDAPLVRAPEARDERNRLIAAMRAAGFVTIRSEWWHFQLPRQAEKPIIDIQPGAYTAARGAHVRRPPTERR